MLIASPTDDDADDAQESDDDDGEDGDDDDHNQSFVVNVSLIML